MTTALEAFRWLLFGQGTLSWPLVIANAAVTVLLVFGGVLLFSRAEKTSMDTV
jgi:lipopolysaccharide transport system permease protein